MAYLPDVNVWIAMYSPGHVHHSKALNWFDQSGASDIVFCRVTQMGFLRLVTNRHVMGVNALGPPGAWGAVDEMLKNTRVFFAKEPPGLEDAWRAVMHQAKLGPNAWTDAYLEAFATQAGVTLVTFDAQLAARKNVSSLLLK
jgi:toxin-antitoxin system PIN domain toxin